MKFGIKNGLENYKMYVDLQYVQNSPQSIYELSHIKKNKISTKKLVLGNVYSFDGSLKSLRVSKFKENLYTMIYKFPDNKMIYRAKQYKEVYRRPLRLKRGSLKWL